MSLSIWSSCRGYKVITHPHKTASSTYMPIPSPRISFRFDSLLGWLRQALYFQWPDCSEIGFNSEAARGRRCRRQCTEKEKKCSNSVWLPFVDNKALYPGSQGTPPPLTAGARRYHALSRYHTVSFSPGLLTSTQKLFRSRVSRCSPAPPAYSLRWVCRGESSQLFNHAVFLVSSHCWKLLESWVSSYLLDTILGIIKRAHDEPISRRFQRF